MKYIKPVLLCLIIGIAMGLFLYSGYENKKYVFPVFGEGEKVTFVRLGIYASEADMNQNAASFQNYIYLYKNQKYYVYIGMTQNQENVKKIKEYYQMLGYIVDEETFSIEHKNFLDVLKKYDEMLNATTDKNAIASIINDVLSKYEELVSIV